MYSTFMEYMMFEECVDGVVAEEEWKIFERDYNEMCDMLDGTIRSFSLSSKGALCLRCGVEFEVTDSCVQHSLEGDALLICPGCGAEEAL